MRLARGAPLLVGLQFAEEAESLPTARLAMAGGLAQLEWTPQKPHAQPLREAG